MFQLEPDYASNRAFARVQISAWACFLILLIGICIGCGEDGTQPEKKNVSSSAPVKKTKNIATPATRKTGWSEFQVTAPRPQARSRHGLVYDSDQDRSLLFGGLIWNGDETLFTADTWELKNNQWRQIAGTVAPGHRQRPGMAYMQHKNKTLLFGGLGVEEFLNDTWTLTGNVWQQVSLAVSPTARCGHGMVSHYVWWA